MAQGDVRIRCKCGEEVDTFPTGMLLVIDENLQEEQITCPTCSDVSATYSAGMALQDLAGSAPDPTPAWGEVSDYFGTGQAVVQCYCGQCSLRGADAIGFLFTAVPSEKQVDRAVPCCVNGCGNPVLNLPAGWMLVVVDRDNPSSVVAIYD